MKTFVRLAGFIALFAFAIMGIAQAQAEGPRLWLSSETQQVTAGQTLTVEVHVGEAEGVYGGSFKVNYDPQVLEAVLTEDGKAVTSGTFFGSQPSFTLSNRADNNVGLIDYALTLTQPAEPVSGEGVLGVLTFKALTDSPVSLTLTDTRLLSPEFTEVDGRKIARKINEVQPQVTDLALSAGTNSAPTIQVTLAPTTAPVIVEQPVEAPVLLTKPMPRSIATSPVMLMGGVLFLVGLGLFAASLGVYIKMRRQFTLLDQESGLW